MFFIPSDGMIGGSKFPFALERAMRFLWAFAGFNLNIASGNGGCSGYLLLALSVTFLVIPLHSAHSLLYIFLSEGLKILVDLSSVLAILFLKGLVLKQHHYVCVLHIELIYYLNLDVRFIWRLTIYFLPL